MSEQDGTQPARKLRGSRQTSKQNGTQKTTLQRPTNNDKKAWMGYWEKQGQPWRIEPEIDAERQKYLDERRSIEPDWVQGIYPFGGIKLNRADIEWLLATHENGRGPVDWSDESQRERNGLDLWGADLRKVDLSGLPLAAMNCGTKMEWGTEQADAAIRMHLEGAIFYDTHLEGVEFHCARLDGATLVNAHLEDAYLTDAHLEGAYLTDAHLEGAKLYSTHLEGAKLYSTHLEGAKLYSTHLEGAKLYSFFDSLTELNDIVLSNKRYGGVSLAAIHWGDVNVSKVDWSKLSVVGDELEARQRNTNDGKPKDKRQQFYEYRAAVRAYRQLATVLRDQGLNEDAARFTYRSQIMQRKVFWYQRKLGQYLFSLFLDLLAGYGYKPWRSFLAYLLVIIAFATAYFVIGHTVGPVLSPLGSVVFSMTSFHGRGFFPGGISLDDPLTVLAAIEAFVGLLIEVTFIATLTQRLFGK